MNERRIKIIIANVKKKIAKNLNIDDEVFALSSIYDFIKNDTFYKELTFLIEEEINYFKDYQKKCEENKKQKENQQLKLQKIGKYKMIWNNKSFFYKLLHRNLNPKNNDLSQMIHEDISNLIVKIIK